MMSSQTVSARGLNSNGWIVRVVVSVIVLGIIAFLMLYRLSEYPILWYDEGSHLHLAKNLALNGIYADYSSEGLRHGGPVVGVGPTIVLPMALAFKIFGVSIPVARVALVTYSSLALLMLFLVGKRLVDFRVGLLAILLLVLSPGAEFTFNGRTVLGEVPALFFMLGGLFLWLKAGPLSPLQLIGVGVMMGLASITKNQYALIVLPSLLISWIVEMVWYRQRGWRYFVIPGVIAGAIFFAWTYAVFFVLAGNSTSDNFSTLGKASSGAFFIFGLEEITKAVQFLVDGETYASLFIPVLIYGVVLGLRRTEDGQRWGILSIFALVSTGLFISSLAWPRYAFPAVALMALFVAHFLHRISDGFSFDWQNLRAVIKGEQPSMRLIGQVITIGLFFVLIARPLYFQFNTVRKLGTTDGYSLAVFLDETVPQDVVVETWEPELGVLTDHNYHYPPQVILAYTIDQVWHEGPPAKGFYDFRDQEVNPEYVVVGAFAKWADIYPADRLEAYDLIHTQGAYDVYQYTGETSIEG